MEKRKLQKVESNIGYYCSPTSLKQRSNNTLYHLKNELNPNEKIIELHNKYVQLKCNSILVYRCVNNNHRQL